ncbi:MAG: formyltransferase family protein [Desulfuromonadales bacterium]
MDYGARFSGCTVHFVDGGVDTGPILIQAVVPILPEDTAETLAARILAQEHRIYPRAIQLIAEGRVRLGQRLLPLQKLPGPSQSVADPGLSGATRRYEHSATEDLFSDR